MSKNLKLGRRLDSVLRVSLARPHGAKGHAAIKRDKKLALRKLGVRGFK